MLSDRNRTIRVLVFSRYALGMNARNSMYLERRWRARLVAYCRKAKDRGAGSFFLEQEVRRCRRSDLFELRVTLDEFPCAAAGKADGKFAVVFIAFDPYDGTDAKIRVAHFSAEHGIAATPL